MFTNQKSFLYLSAVLFACLVLFFIPGFSSAAPFPSETLLDQGYSSVYYPFSWHALPNQGVNRSIEALAVSGDDLYAGGWFYETGDKSIEDMAFISRYDIESQTWHPFPNDGLNGGVMALAVMGDDLYIAGDFTETHDGYLTDLGNIIRYDIKNGTWHPLPNQGIKNEYWGVNALAVLGDDLYVGGDFESTGDGSLEGLNNIARYNTKTRTWHALPNNGFNGYVWAMGTSGKDLYVGGTFSQTGDGMLSNLGNILRFDTMKNEWCPLPNMGLNDSVSVFAFSGSDVYIGGFFNSTGDGTMTDLGHIVHYDKKTETWHALPNHGLDRLVVSLAIFGDDLYAGGNFTGTGDGSLRSLSYIARYNRGSYAWDEMPNQGLIYYQKHLSIVNAMVMYGSDLIVGGRFSETPNRALVDLGNIVRCRLADPDMLRFIPVVYK